MTIRINLTITIWLITLIVIAVSLHGMQKNLDRYGDQLLEIDREHEQLRTECIKKLTQEEK